MKANFQTSSLVLFFLFVVQYANAQSTYYGLNFSYGTHVPGTSFVTNYESIRENYYSDFDLFEEDSDNAERVNKSYGSGLNFGVVVGRMLNPNIGIELGASYLKGNSISSTEEYTSRSYYNGFLNYEYTENLTQSTSMNMFKIMPSLVVSAGGEVFSPYTKFGVVIGSGTVTKELEYNLNETDFQNFSSSSEDEYLVEEQTGGFAFGLGAAVGFNYTINASTSIFAEGYFEALNYSPKSGEITTYEENGVDMIDVLSIAESQYEFVNELTENYNLSPSDDKPAKLLSIIYPMTTAGLRFGVNFHF
jgi:hypothetical protein